MYYNYKEDFKQANITRKRKQIVIIDFEPPGIVNIELVNKK